MLLLACDVGAPDENHVTRNFDRPAVRVIGGLVTTSYDADGRPVRTSLSESAIVEGAVSNASVQLFFSRWLLPHKVLRQSACIHPTSDDVKTIGQCPTQAFAEPAYDPVDRSVTFRLPAGAHLALDTQYRVSVFVTESLDDNGFFAFDGAPVDRPYTFDFRTQSAEAASEEALPSADAYCASIQCFDDCAGDMACEAACRPGCIEPSCYQNGDYLRGSPVNALFLSCAKTQCHAPEFFSGDTQVIAMGLDLSSKSSIEQTAISQTAHQTQQGQSSVVGDQSPQRFGRAMPLVDPGNPGNSYVLYKMLANPLNQPRPGGVLDEGVAQEIQRIRNSFVVGLPMPAQTASGLNGGFFELDFDPDGTLSFEQLRHISAWIAHGAVTSCP